MKLRNKPDSDWVKVERQSTWSNVYQILNSQWNKKNVDFTADKVKMYESVRAALAVICHGNTHYFLAKLHWHYIHFHAEATNNYMKTK